MLLFCLADLHSQILAVKSDLLTGALSSPNFGVEVKLSNRLTLEAGFHYNPFPAGGDKRWKHWFVQPELRYWMCQPFGGHFFGAHLLYGVYNVGGMKLPLGLFKGVRSSRYEGDFMGLGVSYGYHFILAPRWSIETSVGVGFYIPDMNATVVCIAVNRLAANIKTSLRQPGLRYHWYI